ncbi:MAG: nucleotidyltransferase domain-containing protein [Nanoarchaeota archaeon]|nr:nucleotidyltransferase domain-containing protein [Nanoarchaeota archaeon]
MELNDKAHLELKGYDAAYKFAKGIFERYPRVIKSIILFGSYSKGKETESSDVDIMIIMDDVLNNLDNKFLGVFYEDVDKLVKAETSIKLHINFVTLTAFWRGVLSADPVSVNVLKSGVGLIDTGYFEPLQALLQKGEIKPTQESIFAALARSELYIDSAKLRLAGSVLDLYWSVVNAAQALAMENGEVPPSPEVLPSTLESLERMNVINKEDLQVFNEIYSLGRRLVHNEKIELTGADVDAIMLKSQKFKEKIDRIINQKRI